MTPILSYDTETTSEKPATCRVCQVAALLIEETGDEHLPLKMTEVFNEICDPGLESSDAATAIHGIGPEHWAGKRRDSEAMLELHYYLSQNYLDVNGQPAFVVAGHHVKHFDLPILWRVSERAPIFGLPVIDTLTCATRIYPLLPSHRLTTNPKEPAKVGLIESLGLGPVEGAHSAAGDALMVYRLVKHFCEGLQKTPLELAAWCSEARILKYCSFGKHKGKEWGRGPGCVPSGFVYWMTQNFDPTPDLEATVKYHYNMRFNKRASGG